MGGVAYSSSFRVGFRSWSILQTYIVILLGADVVLGSGESCLGAMYGHILDDENNRIPILLSVLHGTEIDHSGLILHRRPYIIFHNPVPPYQLWHSFISGRKAHEFRV
jgi:hypothetical protein